MNKKHKVTCPLCRLRLKKDEQKFVQWHELIKDKRFEKKKKSLLIPFGRTPSGKNIFVDFDKLPNLLIGGSNGSGKTVFIRSLIASLIKKFNPKEVKLALAGYDKKDFNFSRKSPYLFAPVANNAEGFLKLSCQMEDEMNKRYELLEKAGVRDIKMFNRKSSAKMPYIFFIINDLLILLSSYKPNRKLVVNNLVQLEIMARAAGIHLVIICHSCEVRMLPDSIAYNITARMSFQVPIAKDSEDIIFYKGAEKLHGKGDAYLSYCDGKKPGDVRIQTPFISKNDFKK